VVCFEAGEFACGVVQPRGKMFLFTHISRTKKMHTFFINDLIQLYCLRHVSNSEVFIIRKTVQATLKYFFHASIQYKQSVRCPQCIECLYIYIYIYIHTYIYIYIYIYFFFCDAATQRGAWPPLS
jgi:hypothetical protein